MVMAIFELARNLLFMELRGGGMPQVLLTNHPFCMRNKGR
jgi:hypothetical protein